MADNYLERKYEEYIAQKNGMKTPRKHSMTPGKKQGYISIRFPELRVFVTDGAKGIGKSIVEAFRKADCKVAFCDTDTKQGQATAEATGAQFHPIDVTNVQALENSLARVVKNWDDIDVIINNAIIDDRKSITELSAEDFEKSVSNNVLPILVTARQMAEIHKKTANPFGKIINVGLRNDWEENPNILLAATKGNIDCVTKSLAAELEEYNITVNFISYPYLTGEDKLECIAESVAQSCLFLCRPDIKFMNGEGLKIGL